MIIALSACRDDADIYTYRPLLATLKSYDRDDLEWGLVFMQDHPELHEFWGATVSRLNDDQFHLYLDRLDDLWGRTTNLPGVTADTAWAVLSGYRDKDPGTKRSHGTAVFMINAALLTSMKAINFPPAESGVTTYTRYSNFAGEDLHELAPRMIDFAIDRAADVDRIVEIILTENLWHPEALRYRLDGKLTPTTESEELAYPMITKVCDAAPTKLNDYTTTHVKTNKLTAMDVLAINTSHTNSHIFALTEKTYSNDLESLHAHATLITDYKSNGTAFNANTLDLIINDLRAAGEPVSGIDKEMLHRVGRMISTTSANSVSRNAVLSKRSKHWTEYCAALRTATAIGTKAVQEYIEADPKRTIALAVRHEALTHESLISVLEEVVSHGALSDGFL